jgi:hypothetical protein
MRVFVLACLIGVFIISCRDNTERRYGKADNQLKRYLKNDSVRLDYTLQIDTTRSSVDFIGIAENKQDKISFQYPGFVFLDDEVLTFSSQGSVIHSRVAMDAAGLAGKHQITFLFTDNMYFDWQENKAVSKVRDSLRLTFECEFFQMENSIKFSNDSVVFKADKPIQDYLVDLSFFALRKDSTPVAGTNSYVSNVPVRNGLVVIPLTAFKKENYRNYFTDFYFRKEYPLYYRGKEKGKFKLRVSVSSQWYKI